MGRSSTWPKQCASTKQKAATLGKVEAKTALAIIFANGLHNIPPNIELGRRYLTKAAEDGNTSAIATLVELPADAAG